MTTFMEEKERRERAAEAAHEVNRAYCLALGDTSQLPWKDAPEWQKASARNGVNFVLANPGGSPASSHESWLAEKARDGWTWGPVKDATAKTHPCIVPFEQLPREHQAKDFLFRAVVLQFAGERPA